MDTPIIESKLDLDKYKLTMGQRDFFFHPDVQVAFGFINRTSSFRIADHVKLEEMREQLDCAMELQLSSAEKEYLKTWGTLKPEYIEHFSECRLPDYQLWVEDGQIHFEVEGAWSPVTYWETLFLRIQAALTNEGIRMSLGISKETLMKDTERRALEFVQQLKTRPWIRFLDFGTRRPLNSQWHRRVIEITLNEIPEMFLGTSNVHFARTMGIPCFGTDAHESFQVLAGVFGFDDKALRKSVQLEILEMEMLYGEENIIDLTDTWGSESYLNDMLEYQVRKHRGVRIDSMDPVVYSEKLLRPHYAKYGVDPREKVVIPSNNLNLQEIFRIDDAIGKYHILNFASGGGYANNTLLPKVNTVMKAIRANGKPLVKLSDEPGKNLGPQDEISRYRRVFAF